MKPTFLPKIGNGDPEDMIITGNSLVFSNPYPPEQLHIAFEVLRVQIPNVVVSGRHNMLEGVAKPLVGIDVLLFADGKK